MTTASYGENIATLTPDEEKDLLGTIRKLAAQWGAPVNAILVQGTLDTSHQPPPRRKSHAFRYARAY